MKRGENPLTREQAIEFCEERKHMHLLGSENWGSNYRKSGDEMDKLKSEALADLALIYGDIADLLS